MDLLKLLSLMFALLWNHEATAGQGISCSNPAWSPAKDICYRIVQYQMDFVEAQQQCSDYGGSLLLPNNVEQVMSDLGSSQLGNAGQYRINGRVECQGFQEDGEPLDATRQEITYNKFFSTHPFKYSVYSSYLDLSPKSLAVNLQDGSVSADISADVQLGFICQGEAIPCSGGNSASPLPMDLCAYSWRKGHPELLPPLMSPANSFIPVLNSSIRYDDDDWTLDCARACGNDGYTTAFALNVNEDEGEACFCSRQETPAEGPGWIESESSRITNGIQRCFQNLDLCPENWQVGDVLDSDKVDPVFVVHMIDPSPLLTREECVAACDAQQAGQPPAASGQPVRRPPNFARLASSDPDARAACSCGSFDYGTPVNGTDGAVYSSAFQQSVDQTAGDVAVTRLIHCPNYLPEIFWGSRDPGALVMVGPDSYSTPMFTTTSGNTPCYVFCQSQFPNLEALEFSSLPGCRCGYGDFYALSDGAVGAETFRVVGLFKP